MAELSTSLAAKTESGQYKFVGTNSGTTATRTITLANPGASLDRMKLIIAGATMSYGASFYLTAANYDPVGTLVEIYLSAVDTITMKIRDEGHTGTSRNALCWTVERW